MPYKGFRRQKPNHGTGISINNTPPSKLPSELFDKLLLEAEKELQPEAGFSMNGLKSKATMML
jgi:hypothetical protein